LEEMILQTFQPVGSRAGAAGAIGLLLRDLVDYAGLFPPASLPMAACVANYDEYSQSEWNWILGRFIVPVARLDEFEDALAGLPAQPSGTGFTNWRLSVLLGSDAAADVRRVRAFSQAVRPSVRGGAVIDSVEVKVMSAEEVTRLSGIIPAELTIYFEVPLSSCGDCIARIAERGRRAKIRTGGETADKFPAPESVIEFMRLCAAANVPCKATAGLHHPLRSAHRFTYQEDSLSGMMHGFLNVFLAAAFLRTGMEAKIAVRLLEEQSADAFHFDSEEVGWREHRLNRDAIAAARRDFAISFGSCSFTEPVHDLRSLRLL
jgi:hypothetical protein